MYNLSEQDLQKHYDLFLRLQSDFPKDNSIIGYWADLIKLKNGDWKEAYRIIRKIYLRIEPQLIENNFPYFKAYGTDMWRWMNEVEKDFYHQHRSIGGIPLYPLYFVNGYYLDFANPKHKIGIEVDGKAYHDAEKDLKRDMDLSDFGWKILRISAADVLKDQVYLTDIEEQSNDMEREEFERKIREFFSGYATGLLFALRVLYRDKWSKDHLYYQEAERCLYKRMLAAPEEDDE